MVRLIPSVLILLAMALTATARSEDLTGTLADRTLNLLSDPDRAKNEIQSYCYTANPTTIDETQQSFVAKKNCEAAQMVDYGVARQVRV